MSLINLLINVVAAAIIVIIAFWLLSMIAASIPVVAVTLLKIFIVLVAVGWILGYMGPRIVS